MRAHVDSTTLCGHGLATHPLWVQVLLTVGEELVEDNSKAPYI